MGDIPIFYVYLKYKLNEISNNKLVSSDECLKVMKRFNIPKKIRKLVLEEMEEYKLIFDLGSHYKINSTKVNINVTRKGRNYLYMKSLLDNNFFEY